jgi:eukaryotic translation initiation factor 2C
MQDRPATVDARIKDGSDKAVVASLNRQTGADDNSDSLPLRPDFGTRGREISLRANYFPVEVKGQIYRYSAAITLPSDKKLTRRAKQRVFQLAEQSVDWQQAGMPGRVAHDSAEKLVASILLPQPLTIRGAYYHEEEDAPSRGGTEYALTLTLEEEVDQQLLNEYIAFDCILEPSDLASIQLPCRGPCRLSSAIQGPFRAEPRPHCTAISDGN